MALRGGSPRAAALPRSVMRRGRSGRAVGREDVGRGHGEHGWVRVHGQPGDLHPRVVVLDAPATDSSLADRLRTPAATNLPYWKIDCMLADMESSEPAITPSEAQAAIADAEAARTRLASSLHLPSYFYSSIGAAIAVQIATGATGIANQETWGMVLLSVGVLVFVLVAAVQLARFRRLNGAWLGGLASQVLLGTAGLASITYVAAFALATWAAFAGAGWLTPIAAVAGGAVYAGAGRRWWRSYQGAPAEHSRGEQTVVVVVAVVLAVAFLGALVVLR